MAKTQATRGMTVEQKLAHWSAPAASGCVLWTLPLDIDGYARLHRPRGQKGTRLAHRLAWEIANGTVPNGLMVCHTCDVRHCLNVNHLFLGTAKDNHTDMVVKGRAKFARGEKINAAKLTPELVRKIRDDARTLAAIGRDYGIDPSNVAYIKKRVTWKHVD